jgi:hypothetical protein
MLLELHRLNESLRTAGITAEQKDNHLVSYPSRQSTLEVRLDADGRVVSVRSLAPEQTARLLKFEVSKGGDRESTPGFNVEALARPRKDVDEKEFTKDLTSFLKGLAQGKPDTEKKRREKFEAILERTEPNWDHRIRVIDKCLKTAAGLLIDGIGPENHVAELEPLLRLLQRSQKLSAAALRLSLLEHVREAVIEAAPDAATLARLAFDAKKKATLILELSDAEQFDYPANHETIWRAMNRHLLASTSESPGTPDSGLPQGIFGEPCPDTSGKMPEVKLPRLGNVKLRSLSAQIPCQSRYGLIEAKACPVGSEIQKDLAATLSWVTQGERESRTWADVSSAGGFPWSTLLIAYPSSIEEQPPSLSGFLAFGNAAKPDATFEQEATPVLDALKGIARRRPHSTIAVFALAKVDTARSKVLYSRQIEVEKLLDAAAQWQTASLNHPPIAIRVFGADQRPTWREPLTPFPAQLVRCLNVAWLKGCKVAKVTMGLGLSDGFGLLLDTGPALRQTAAMALRVALDNTTSLLLALGQEQAQNRVLKLPGRDGAASLLLPRVLAILLAKLDTWKEAYMDRNHYLIGRLMSVADRMHMHYCKTVRKGDIPPQLIGNAIMPTALESPVAGLARLADRLPLYQRSAPVWLRREAAEIEASMDKVHLPGRCTDEDKAQMLLGYLARTDAGRANAPGSETDDESEEIATTVPESQPEKDSKS